LTEKITPGSYILYAKVDPTYKTHKLPQNAVVNLYSKSFPSFHAVPRTKYPTLIRDTFLNHAFHNKKNEFSEGKIWISWQLLFQKGGFAYLAAGNNRDSQQTVVINFS
jgi:hypothetical protein